MPDSLNFRLVNERLSLLMQFMRQGARTFGDEPDPDVVTAHNLATEAALYAVYFAALDLCPGRRLPRPSELPTR